MVTFEDRDITVLLLGVVVGFTIGNQQTRRIAAGLGKKELNKIEKKLK